MLQIWPRMLLQHGRNRMLLFWVFKYGPSKSEIFLELNLRLINILLKGRSASLPPGMTMKAMNKQMCHLTIYQILSSENPTDYPKKTDVPGEFYSSYSSSGGSCTIRDEFGSMTIQNCDCSNPKSYNFYDEGRF